MIKYGLKLWTTNSPGLAKASKKLLEEKAVDFLELYIHPGSQGISHFNILKGMEISIHATHFDHGFNLSALDNEAVKFFKEEVIRAADFFGSHHIILHPGASCDSRAFLDNFEKIRDPRILIENMPKFSLDGQVFFGYSLEELIWIRDNTGSDFCLDLGHAIASAFAQKIGYKEYVSNLLLALDPHYFHIGGKKYDSNIDEHLNLWEGTYDLAWVKSLIQKKAEEKDSRLVFEIKREGLALENELKNVEYFKSF